MDDTDPIEIEITSWVDPADAGIGRWTGRTSTTAEIRDAYFNGDGSLPVTFVHEGRRYVGKAIIAELDRGGYTYLRGARMERVE